MFEKEPEVLVAGAGPVGLFTALQLVHHGLRPQVVDEQWRTASRSYALALHPESLHLLDELGLLGEVLERAHRIDAVALHDGQRERARLDLSRLQAPFPFVVVLPQRELEAVLEAALAARGVRVQWNHRLAELEAGEDRVDALVERMGKDSTGYGFATMTWVVDKVLRSHPAFVIGADGHRSTVRRAAGIPLQEVGGSQLFGVFELVAAQQAGREVTVVLDEGTTNALWPMGGNRCRWTFELFDWEMASELRHKDRLHVRLGAEGLPYTAGEKLDELIAQRVPWFAAEVQQVLWSAAVRFERRMGRHFGAGRLVVVGDAAHLTSPVGVQSMNLGLREGAAVAATLRRILREGAPHTELTAWESAAHREWSQLLEIDGPPLARRDADSWVRQNAFRILPCVPASGEQLSELLWQIGLVLPAPAREQAPAVEAM
jgi:6-methylpretetramide 4-monooxygenase / 4-hydroxy-6-methylpretetramide 12a-monooxygenase